MANSPEASLKEAVRNLNNCEESLLPMIESALEKNKDLGIEGGDVMLAIIYERLVKARDLVTDALNWDEPEK